MGFPGPKVPEGWWNEQGRYYAKLTEYKQTNKQKMRPEEVIS